MFEKIVDATASVSLNADAQYEAQLSDGKASDVSLTPKSLAGGDAEDDAEDGSKQQESAENSPTAVGGSQMPMGTEYNPRHSSASPRYYSRGRGRGRGGMRSYNNNGGHHRSSNGSGGRYNNNGGHYSMQQYPQQQQQQYIPAGTTGYYQFVPVMDWETLKYCLMTQIEYYFSVENLCRDLFFRQKASLI